MSDKIVPFIYSPQVRKRFRDVDLIIGCGDLAYYYLEYVLNALDRPMYFVRGNHDKVVEYSLEGQRTAPHGGVDLHRRVLQHDGLLLAGVEGSLRYRPGRFQYSQAQMWRHVWHLVPDLLKNRALHGRFLDVFVSHAPPEDIHDETDLPHRGIKAFRWLVNVFQPAYFIHGHVHIYHPETPVKTQVGGTLVINAYEFHEIMLDIKPGARNA
ncbi:MAG: metallophosphoesterase [Chloroflexota bacterium]